MPAMAVVAGQADSSRLNHVPEPPADNGDVLIEPLAIGICGTDEIVPDDFGALSPGAGRPMLGHGSLGSVVDSPDSSGVASSDPVVSIVRRSDPAACPDRAVGERDLYCNSRYIKHAIDGRNGDASAPDSIPPLLAQLLERQRGSISDARATADIVMEPTEVSSAVLDILILARTGPDASVCLTGVSSDGRQLTMMT